MPIPYMGSKRSFSIRIYNCIASREEKGTLVDPFCGGLAVSEEFASHGWKVRASDWNKYVVALAQKVMSGDGVFEKIFDLPRFIPREEFEDALKNPDDYEDWWVGYIKYIWSFGNNGRGYLFGKETELIKLAGHLWAVNNYDIKVREIFGDTIPERYYEGVKKQPDWHKRRIAIARIAKKIGDRRLERLEQLELLERLQRLEQLERLQQLERLERLERLQQLDYRNADIKEGDVVYLDPPYANTGGYARGNSEDTFDNGAFWEWANKIARTNHVYVSEYTAPEGWEAILTFPKKTTMAGGTRETKPEKLFVKKKGE